MLMLALLGCSSPPPPSARAPEPVGTPLPPGLDLTLRADLASLRAELGQELARQVLRDAFSDRASAERGPPPLLDSALDRSDVLWLGFPSLAEQAQPENVLLLRGHFASLGSGDPAARWSGDGSGLASLELPENGAAGYVRVYRAPGDELLAWASRSTRDTLERALRSRSREQVMRPPERGAVSVAARPGPLLERYSVRYPELVERFRGLRRVEAFAEPSGSAWRADLTLDFDTPEQAREASQVAERLREVMAQRACAVGALARTLSITTFERNLRVTAALLGPELDVVRSCVLGDGCCA
ncbi:MAG TPA: hypothetical protein VNN80_31810 [Polyangiaceae bacterium]|nr:hypothetical protein [Polyangiaceae bacterium]